MPSTETSIETSNETTEQPAKRALDLRLVIALLIGAYGVVLTVLGIGFTTDAEIAKAAGVNIDLWAGIGMLVFAASFLLWARLRPLEVPPATDEPSDQPTTDQPTDEAPDEAAEPAHRMQTRATAR